MSKGAFFSVWGKLEFVLIFILVAQIASQALLPRMVHGEAGDSSATINVFRDLDFDSIDNNNDFGLQGITVNAYDDDSSITASTDATGAVTFAFASEPTMTGGEYRIELDTASVPSHLAPGFVTGTDEAFVQFIDVSASAASVGFPLVNGGDWCGSDPDLATTCFIESGAGVDESLYPAVVEFDADETGASPTVTSLAEIDEVGSTYGLAHDSYTDHAYVGSYVKRHAANADNEGAIYKIDNTGSIVGGAPWVTLAAGTATHTTGDWFHDAVFDEVGKTGLGDIDISEDNSTLYVVNLFDQSLYELNTTTGSVSATTAINGPSCTNGTWRPFALEIQDDDVYVGGVCTAEGAGGTAADLEAHIVKKDGATFNSVFNFSLGNVDRGCTNRHSSDAPCPFPTGTFPSHWQPWFDDFTDLGTTREWQDDGTWYAENCTYGDCSDKGGVITNDRRFLHGSQPIFSDLEWVAGDWVIGIRDRLGDQAGSGSGSTVVADPILYDTVSAGDILRACSDGIGGWNLENNGSCGSLTGQNVATGYGYGGGEFYYDRWFSGYSSSEWHAEVSQGSIAYAQDTPSSLYLSALDPLDNSTNAFSGGIRENVTSSGAYTEAVQLYGSSTEYLGKASGLGDTELFCEAAPIEVGNRVWIDANKNGTQDPSEASLGGITVELLDSGSSSIATAVTDASGHYYFSSATGSDTASQKYGLSTLTHSTSNFTVRIDTTQTPITSGGYIATLPDSGTTDLSDSDGHLSGNFTQVSFNTQDAGDNNFTLDFGFSVGAMRIGNLLFHDVDNDAIAGAAEDGIQLATIQLWEDTTADTIFNPANDTLVGTTTTDVNGKYWFEGVGNGTYFVALPTTGNTATTIGSVTNVDLADLHNSTAQGLTNAYGGSSEPTSDSNADNDDDGKDKGNAAIPAGYITFSDELILNAGTEPTAETTTGGVAGADETEANAQGGSIMPNDNDSNLTLDFGFFGLPDISVDKLVDGSDVDTTPTDSEYIDLPPALGATAFKYHISATNQSTIIDGTNVVLTDYIPEGVTIASVDSVTTGSVSTSLPITSVSPFGTTTITWNIGTIPAGDTETLVLNAELQDANTATFIANTLSPSNVNQNVSQITAMTEDDTDSTVNSHTITDPSTFTSAGSEDDEDDASVFLPQALGDYVWEDTNNDGLQTIGEPGINGVTVNLYIDDDITPGPSVGDTLDATTVTATNGPNDGYYVFSNLASGTDYWVEFDHTSAALALYAPTTQGPSVDPNDATDSDGDVTTGWTEIHNLNPSEMRMTVDQGYVPKLSIGNLVWEDRNNDGDVDAGEPGLSGVVVELYVDTDDSGTYTAGDTLVTVTGSNSATAGESVTDGSGNWLFEGLMPEDYVARIPDVNSDTGGNYVSSTGNTDDLTTTIGAFEPAPDVDTVTTNNDDNGEEGSGATHETKAVTLAYNSEPDDDGDLLRHTNLSVDFGFFTPFSIGNRVWLDNGGTTGTPNDGMQNGDESVLTSVTVNLYAASDTGFTSSIDTTTTDGAGYYRFDNLTPGSYIVEVVTSTLPAGIASSTLEETLNTPDQKDHGQNTPNTNSNYVSNTVALGYGLQPTDEIDIMTGNGAESPHGDAYSNLAIDFGFTQTGDVSVDKQVDSGIYTLGTADTRTYTILVTNNGPSDATGISVIDNVPNSHITFSAWTCAVTTAGTGSLTESCENASGSGNIAETVTLNVGGVATYTVTAQFDDTTTGTITNQVDVALPSTLVQDSSNLPDVDTVDVTPQLQTPAVSLNKQLYEGHDSGALCNSASAVDQLVIVDKDQSFKDITYCFTVTNTGNTHLDTLTLSDPTLGINTGDMTLHGSSSPVPLAPGNSVTYYYDTTTNTSVDNTADVTARPTLSDGNPTGQPNVTDIDSNAILVYVFDPPFGQKTGTLDSGETIISWDMVWINDSPILASNVIISDEVPADTTYAGNLVCSPQGSSIVNSCIYESPNPSYPRGRVVVDADIASDPGATTPDNASNEVVISFDVTIDNPALDAIYENQADLTWMGLSATSDDPTVSGPNDPASVGTGALSDTGVPAYVATLAGFTILAGSKFAKDASKRRWLYKLDGYES